ncbi:MAG: sugar phosphate isomerase/epimerase [Syntrophobacteraceae bacterium]|jgi:sugar phosphate isomerase/epimerase|nr:sugar phosphate isomerase/epimerase [Syntrophobacteraceae bacterium]
MKFGYSTTLFRLRPLQEAIELIGKGGFNAVELLADRPHAFPEDISASESARLMECLGQRKLKACNLCACSVSALGVKDHPSWLEEDWVQRETRIRYTLDCLRLSAAMGIPSVSTIAAGRIPSTMNRADAWRLFVANMQRVLPLARKLAVKVLIQPEPELLLERSEEMLAFLREFEMDPFMQVDFNLGHFYCAGEDPLDAWETLKSHVGIIHIEDVPADRKHKHVQLGEGSLDIQGFLRRVLEAEYEGYVVVRLDSYDQNPEDVVQTSAAYLKRAGFMPNRVDV